MLQQANEGHLFGPKLPLDFFAGKQVPDAKATIAQACQESPDACNDNFLSLPWVPSEKKADYNFAIADFTPNYMCSPTAMQNIAKAAEKRGVKDKVKILVSLREPLERAFSEWSMFALSWEWDKTPNSQNFSSRMEDQVTNLRSCNETLFRNTELLQSLPDEELFAYVGKVRAAAPRTPCTRARCPKRSPRTIDVPTALQRVDAPGVAQCFGARAMEYVGNSLYSPCLLMAQRIFPPEQFHVLRYEDLYTSRPADLVEELAKFTGLTLDDAAVSRSTSENGPCHFNMAGNGPMHMSTDDKQNQGELHASEESLAYFFRPYNELLAKLVRPGFGWNDRPVFRWLSVRRPPTPIAIGIPGRVPRDY